MEPEKSLNHPVPTTRRRRVGGMTWILIGIALLFAVGGVMTALRKNVAPTQTLPSAPLSYLGINEFEDATGGVTFEDVWPPDGPADKAGLVGGDVITAFDGHATVDEKEMRRLLATTPSGKTVEIVYIRDGETKKTSLTTMSQSEVLQLDGAFTNRGTSRGQLGFEDIDAVPVPGKNIKGVLLERISPSGPAALAGLLEGDIIIEFDGVPIRTVSELVLRARRAIPYSTVKVVIFRGTEQLEIPVKVGKRG
ncbi:MAG TPA: PDZ domain-containing protein [Pyrinomonadaceae bacterium]|nr:PDZ domain-containing protein [Pyrinomonadaceae bacterium]